MTTYEYIANKNTKVVHRVVQHFGRYWRSGCDVDDENEDVFAGEAEALECIEKVDGYRRCSRCWTADGVLTFPGDAAETVTTTTGEGE